MKNGFILWLKSAGHYHVANILRNWCKWMEARKATGMPGRWSACFRCLQDPLPYISAIVLNKMSPCHCTRAQHSQ